MGFFQACLFCFTIGRLLPLSLLLLLILQSSFPQEGYMVEGSRPLSPKAIMSLKEKQVKTMMGRALIGSRPPRCERRCKKCGHCEAIQVPVVPQHHQNSQVGTTAAGEEEEGRRREGRSHHLGNSVPRLQYSRGDGLSNYKPMSWKCKCGNLIFNP